MAVLVLSDADELDSDVRQRRELFDRFESLREAVDACRDLEPGERAARELAIDAAVARLRVDWRVAAPLSGTSPVLRRTGVDRVLVLARDEAHG